MSRLRAAVISVAIALGVVLSALALNTPQGHAQQIESKLVSSHEIAPGGNPPLKLDGCETRFSGTSSDLFYYYGAKYQLSGTICINPTAKSFRFVIWSRVRNSNYNYDFPFLCEAAGKLLDRYLAAAGYAPFNGSKACGWDDPCADCTFSRLEMRDSLDQFSWITRTDFPLPPKLKTAAQNCPDPQDLAGAWYDQRPEMKALQTGGLRLDFNKGASGVEGRRTYETDRGWAADAPTSVTHLTKPPAQAASCLIHANCWDSKGSSRQCALLMDSTGQGFTFRARSGGTLGEPLYAGARYATGAAPPAKAEVSCPDNELDGNWTRADGARISITAMDMKDGGQALMFNAPSDWPKGVFKFSAIKAAGKCAWNAQCATVYRDTTGQNGYRVVTAACSLNLDPSKRRLTASGPHGVYAR